MDPLASPVGVERCPSLLRDDNEERFQAGLLCRTREPERRARRVLLARAKRRRHSLSHLAGQAGARDSLAKDQEPLPADLADRPRQFCPQYHSHRRQHGGGRSALPRRPGPANHLPGRPRANRSHGRHLHPEPAGHQSVGRLEPHAAEVHGRQRSVVCPAVHPKRGPAGVSGGRQPECDQRRGDGRHAHRRSRRPRSGRLYCERHRVPAFRLS